MDDFLLSSVQPGFSVWYLCLQMLGVLHLLNQEVRCKEPNSKFTQ